MTTKAKGTGLGLAMVRHIIEEHQGRVEVESEKGKGARFRVRFPGSIEQSLAAQG